MDGPPGYTLLKVPWRLLLLLMVVVAAVASPALASACTSWNVSTSWESFWRLSNGSDIPFEANFILDPAQVSRNTSVASITCKRLTNNSTNSIFTTGGFTTLEKLTPGLLQFNLIPSINFWETTIHLWLPAAGSTTEDPIYDRVLLAITSTYLYFFVGTGIGSSNESILIDQGFDLTSSQYLGSRWNGSASFNAYAVLRTAVSICVLVNDLPIYCLPTQTQSPAGPWIFAPSSGATTDFSASRSFALISVENLNRRSGDSATALISSASFTEATCYSVPVGHERGLYAGFQWGTADLTIRWAEKGNLKKNGSVPSGNSTTQLRMMLASLRYVNMTAGKSVVLSVPMNPRQFSVQRVCIPESKKRHSRDNHDDSGFYSPLMNVLTRNQNEKKRSSPGDEAESRSSGSDDLYQKICGYEAKFNLPAQSSAAALSSVAFTLRYEFIGEEFSGEKSDASMSNSLRSLMGLDNGEYARPGSFALTASMVNASGSATPIGSQDRIELTLVLGSSQSIVNLNLSSDNASASNQSVSLQSGSLLFSLLTDSSVVDIKPPGSSSTVSIVLSLTPSQPTGRLAFVVNNRIPKRKLTWIIVGASAGGFLLLLLALGVVLFLVLKYRTKRRRENFRDIELRAARVIRAPES